ncbi:MAG TPA: membrane dipeptidase [Roseiflexaceae bacterium]|nr:membrane dipeptidase [Roseiflexaceae bacterium]HMP38947.1 membrane dipeptidase [Roseiflexaceae bacterium]
MLIIDAHLDLSWNALQWNRDLLLSVYTMRALEAATPGKGRGLGTVALPEMRRGRIAVCIATLIARSTGRSIAHIDFSSPAQAHAVARGQLAYYRALEQLGHVRILTDAPGLAAHWQAWQQWETTPTTACPPPGFVISMEGADPILAPDTLEEWWAAGLRLIGITHYGPGRYAGGTGTELGLTELGPALLAEMERLGMVLDLTHCSDQAFWQALERFGGAVIASHNNSRTIVPHQRQFDDDQIRAIAARDGVIGAALDAWMLVPGWVPGERPDPANPPVTLTNVADQIDHVCQLTSSSRHAAIGSDLDGGFGREQSPTDLDTIADLQQIAELLARRGYRSSDIDAIMHGNWLRLLEHTL